MKYLSITLLILCFACNDGGSDPEIVKAETDLANAKRGYDSALNENIRLMHITDSLRKVRDSLQSVNARALANFMEDLKRQDSALWKEYNKRIKQ